MSAVFLVKQRDSVHLISDTVACSRDGIIGINNLAKCIAIPVLNMAVAFMGDVKVGPYFSISMAWSFTSFDDVIERGETILPKIYAAYVDSEPDLRRDCAVMYFIGWHERQNRPGAYSMLMSTDDSRELAKIVGNSPSNGQSSRFKLYEQSFCGSPTPGMDVLRSAGFRVPEDLGDIEPERDLLHLLQISRLQKNFGHYWIGGMALLTSIDSEGIRQRIVHRWDEDWGRLGKTISPKPIDDWTKWRAARAMQDSEHCRRSL